MFGWIALGCSTAHQAAPSAGVRKPAAAALPTLLPASEEDDLDLRGASAAMLLDHGFREFRNNRDERSARAFRAAIATGDLNDAGRTLAYWHVYVAERALGHEDASADALLGFLVVGEEVLDTRGTLRYAVNHLGDFVTRFDLVRRLARSRAELSAIWARRVPYFGRSRASPVLVRDIKEIGYFVEMAPPCAHAFDRAISRQRLPDAVDGTLERVTITCGVAQQGTDYYFLAVR